jgi:hypothetical protein
VKVQRFVAAVSLALALMVSAPVARAGVEDPSNGPQGFIASLGECLSQAVVLGLDIVSSVL